MATTYGLSSTDIQPEVGFRAARNENGGWTGSHAFTIKRELWAQGSGRANFARGTPVIDLDDSLPVYFSFLVINSFTVTNEECEWVRVEVDLSGSATATYPTGEDEDPEDPTYHLDGALEEVPFMEHPKWKALTDFQKTVLGWLLSGSYVWDIDEQKAGVPLEDGSILYNTDSSNAITASPDAAAFADRIAQGKTTYKRPTITWAEYANGTTRLTPQQLNSLGRVSAPRGNPPQPTGGRDWMLTSASQNEQAAVFSTSIQWTLSEKGGHDSFLYED